jgi:hypothetical protein
MLCFKYICKTEKINFCFYDNIFAIFKKIFVLFICAYNVWVIASPTAYPLPYPRPAPSLSPLTPCYQAETILPLSLILLKREYKQ